MIAFHGDTKVKEKYLNRVKAHRLADNLIQGEGWKRGKGCAVGCTLEAYDHSRYPIELGIPEWLAMLEDRIFEGLPNDKAQLFPEQFLSSINTGADLEKVKTPFLIFILESCLENMDKCEYDKRAFPDVEKAIEGSRVAVKNMIECHKKGGDLSAAWSAARSAAWSARSAAESAWSARSAAESAESAARSAESAARSAAWSARSAAESAAESAAGSAAYEKFADKLIGLLKECT